MIFLVCLIAAASDCVLRPAVTPYLVLVAASIAWLVANGPIEGPTLISLTHTHGVTVADLAVVAAWLVVGLTVVKRSSSAAPSRPAGRMVP